MTDLAKPSSDVAFSPSVKAVQERRGSRQAYAKREEKGGFRTAITAELAEFLSRATSFYFATASASGQPYVQHRGGPAGFLRVLGDTTLGFADYAGNRQYITTGNLVDNPLAQIFVMDYAHRRRIKIWGNARVVEADANLITRLFPTGYEARAEQAILFDVTAWDSNCQQHIPQLFPAEAVARTVRQFQDRMRELDQANAELKARIEQLESEAAAHKAAHGREIGDRTGD